MADQRNITARYGTDIKAMQALATARRQAASEAMKKNSKAKQFDNSHPASPSNKVWIG
jgi:hypothetical protein